MKNLPGPVRDKAIEIANALLLERNMEEGLAIAIAISRAKEWAEKHLPPATTDIPDIDDFF